MPIPAATPQQYALPDGLPPQPKPGQVVVLPEGTYRYEPSYSGTGYRWHRVEAAGSVGVSPNIQETMTPEQVQTAFQSPEHQQAKRRYREIADSEGLETLRAADAEGRWAGGQENSVLLEFQGPVQWEQLIRAGSRMGLVSEEIYGSGNAQKYVLAFIGKKNGASRKLRVTFPHDDDILMKIEQAAEAARMPGWTVIRHENFTEFIAIEGKAKMQRFNRAVKALTKSKRQIRSSMLAGEHDVWGSLDRKEAARTFRTLSGIPE